MVDDVEGRAGTSRGTAPPIIQYWHDGNPPDYVEALLTSFRDLNPEMPHLVFSEQEAEEFIADHFTRRELNAFRACAVPAMQADYFRYCAAFALGGFWSDVDVRCVAPLEPLLPPPGGGHLFMGRQGVPISSAFAFGSPGHPFPELALEIATRNIERRLDAAVLLVTGPMIFISIVKLGELGSLDAGVGTGVDGPYARVIRGHFEQMGGYARVERALEGIEVDIFKHYLSFIRQVDEAELPYKRTGTHWTKAKGPLFRSTR
jgi:hypothetical protein